MHFSVFDSRRLELYLGGLLTADFQEPQTAIPVAAPIICKPLEAQARLEARISDVYPDGLGSRYKIYVRQAQALFARFDQQARFSVYAEDSRVRFASPVIVKSRLIRDRDAKGVLLPLEHSRHWGPIPELRECDRPFNDKDNRLIWRGVTTGVFSKAERRMELPRPHSARYSDGSGLYSARYHLALLDDLADGIDLKFTELVQMEDGCDLPLEVIMRKLGNEMTMQEQLASKFLLCLEGNDVATGLKWMMASNSTVIMPKPTCETWFCEGELQPWVQYVPVADDLSDINDVYEWCLSNLPAAEEIAQNGRAFVRNFVDKRRESQLIKTVISTYARETDFQNEGLSGGGSGDIATRLRLWNVARKFDRTINACSAALAVQT